MERGDVEHQTCPSSLIGYVGNEGLAALSGVGDPENSERLSLASPPDQPEAVWKVICEALMLCREVEPVDLLKELRM